jgi:hypothetical protein
MSDYARPRHRVIARVLAALDASFLEVTRCYFGGGTRLVLELDEYRESQDLDFLCSDIAGYRILRAGVSQDSLGALFRKSSTGVSLMREVRADRYGIRTVLAVAGQPVKFEIILEARIAVTGTRVRGLPIPALDRASCFAEKWLANADRWNDVSVMSRDAIDLAFMLRAWSPSDAQAGATLATQAYGAAIGQSARAAAGKIINNPAYLKQCAGNLALDDMKALKSGLKKLERFAASIGG